MSGKTDIEIVDVTARDGLQNESVMFSTEDKLRLIDGILATGAKRIEVASFAHPKYVPQMADAEAVIEGLPRRDDVTYIGLVMNERGVDRALKTDIDEIGLVAAASDTFGLKNQGQTRDGSVDMACEMIRRVKAEGCTVSVTIATSFGCPFDGETDPADVIHMVRSIAAETPREIALADTIGVGNPWQVKDLFAACMSAAPDMSFRAHFHNTRNTGLANVHAAMEAGVKTIDVSIGGIGGCPFAPAATGNVPAEDVVYMLHRGGYTTGLDLPKIMETANWLSEKMDKTLPGMVTKAGIFPKAKSEAKA